MSDMSRLEAKMERLTDQLASKERELQTITSKVFFDVQLEGVSKPYSCTQITEACLVNGLWPANLRPVNHYVN